jgi:hypothetical protein
MDSLKFLGDRRGQWKNLGSLLLRNSRSELGVENLGHLPRPRHPHPHPGHDLIR